MNYATGSRRSTATRKFLRILRMRCKREPSQTLVSGSAGLMTAPIRKLGGLTVFSVPFLPEPQDHAPPFPTQGRAAASSWLRVFEGFGFRPGAPRCDLQRIE